MNIKVGDKFKVTQAWIDFYKQFNAPYAWMTPVNRVYEVVKIQDNVIGLQSGTYHFDFPLHYFLERVVE